MEKIDKEILEKLSKIQIDIEFIKENIGDEEELTDWAKEELKEARTRSLSEKLSHEEVKRRILTK